MKIGCMGGCINKQKGLPGNELYHRRLMEELMHSEPDANIVLASYLSYRQLPADAQAFLAKTRPDVLCLFIRPFPILPLLKPLVKFDRDNNKVGYGLHSALFNRKHTWPARYTRHLTSGNFAFTPRSERGIRDMNLLAGKIFGLHQWAMQYIGRQVDAVESLCRAANVRLIILGPPQYSVSATANKIFGEIDQFLSKKFEQTGQHYIELYPLSEKYFEQDKIHLNKQGHSLIADKILLLLVTKINANLVHAPV